MAACCWYRAWTFKKVKYTKMDRFIFCSLNVHVLGHSQNLDGSVFMAGMQHFVLRVGIFWNEGTDLIKGQTFTSISISGDTRTSNVALLAMNTEGRRTLDCDNITEAFALKSQQQTYCFVVKTIVSAWFPPLLGITHLINLVVEAHLWCSNKRNTADSSSD